MLNLMSYQLKLQIYIKHFVPMQFLNKTYKLYKYQSLSFP